MMGGVLLGLGASACWAVANVAVARSARRIGAFRALLWSQVVGVGLVVAVSLPLDVRTAPFRPVDAGWLLGAGAAALLAYVGLFYAFEHGKLTTAVPVMSSWAVLASALSLLLFHERVRPAQLAGAAAVVTGVLIVGRHAQRQADGGAGPVHRGTPRWLLAAVGAAIGFGLLIPAIGRLAPVAGSVGAIGAVYVADIVLGLPLAWRWGVALAPPAGAAWIPVALAGLFETAGFACIALGGRHAPMALVAPLASLASAFTVLYAWAVLRERPPAPVLLGAALACVGVVAMAF